MNELTARRVSATEGLAFNSLKQLLRWDDDFKVHQPDIDRQHEAIFDLALRTSDLARHSDDQDKLTQAFHGFGELLHEHFRCEEDELAAIGFAGLEGHRAQHNAMLSEFDFIGQRLASQGEGWAYAERAMVVLNFMIGVTVGHILRSDAEYALPLQTFNRTSN